MPFSPPPGQHCGNCLCYDEMPPMWEGPLPAGFENRPPAGFCMMRCIWAAQMVVLSGATAMPAAPGHWCGQWRPSRELDCGMCALWGAPECPRRPVQIVGPAATARACRSFEGEGKEKSDG